MKPVDATGILFMADLMHSSLAHLKQDNATVTPFVVDNGRTPKLEFEIRIKAIGGHKLPATRSRKK